jgi:hypothetical protein
MKLGFAPFLLALVACAETKPAVATPVATPVAQATTTTVPSDVVADHKAAYARATALTHKRDFTGAIRELDPIEKATATNTDLSLAYWIHNELTWIYWGRGDLRGALNETELGGKALDRSKLGADEIASMRLHALWDRAYLLLELGDADADKAFTDYETPAKARNDHDGLAVLNAFFFARRRRGSDAMTAAKQVNVEQDSDLQDLYVIALAFDAGGDTQSAKDVRQRICKGNDYLMKPLILAQMEREGFRCP